MITVKTICFLGIEVREVDVQLSLAPGVPGFSIVGLGDKAVSESKERVKSSMTAMGLKLPAKKIIVNLAPADLIKEGTHFDLPIAMALIAAVGILTQEQVGRFIFLGELSLDGSIRAVPGVLPAAIHAKINGLSIGCPAENGSEAAWAGKDLEIAPVKHISKLISYIKDGIKIDVPKISAEKIEAIHKKDFADISGQKAAKRAVAIAVAGYHNMLMVGSPGCGKSMIASRVNTITPDLDIEEMLSVSMIYSISGLIKNGNLSTIRPFRSPHHSASMPSMIGGGKNARPGEITLAHFGVLFLDELPEFPKQIIDSLRQPIEDKTVSISRINAKIIYPCKFQLITAMNPCKCGYYKSNTPCVCSPQSIKQYQSKVSGPIIDRIDLKIWMSNEKYNISDYSSNTKDPINSRLLKTKVLKAQEIQRERYRNEDVKLNGELEGELIKKYCIPQDKNFQDFLSITAEQKQLSMRSINKILKLSRTIADFEESPEIQKKHLEEAIFYNTDFSSNM